MDQASFLSGYGLNIRALRPEDIAEYNISEPEGAEFQNCVAIEGEDMAAMLAVVVDVSEHKIVWRNPDLTSDAFDGPEAGERIGRALEEMIMLVLPEVHLPAHQHQH